MGLLESIGITGDKGGIGGLLGGVMGGIDNMAGDILTGGAFSNSKDQAAANAMNMHLADKQQAFQERMSNSAYQRAMEDMRKAGLNPILASQVGGASTPSGSLAHVSSVESGKIGAGLANTAKDLVGLQNTKSVTDLNKSTAATKDSEVELNEADTLRSRADRSNKNADTTLKLEQMQTEQQRKRGEKAKADITEMERDVTSARNPTEKFMAPAAPILDRLKGAFVGGGARGTIQNYPPGGSPNQIPYQRHSGKSMSDAIRRTLKRK